MECVEAYMPEPISMDLFAQNYPGAQLEITEMSGRYVSEKLNRWQLESMTENKTPIATTKKQER